MLGRLSAAAHTAAEGTRRSGGLARGRATRAAAALRGQTSPSPWRWAGYGLATGVAVGIVIGAAVATIARHTRHHTPPGDSDTDDAAADTHPAETLGWIRDTVATAATKIRDVATRTPRTSTTPHDTGDAQTENRELEPDPTDPPSPPDSSL